MSAKKIHYPKAHYSKRRVGLILFWGSVFIYLGIVLIFSFILDPENYQPSLIIIVLKVLPSFTPFAALFGLLLLATTTIKIVTSSQGIEFHQSVLCAKTTWNNVYKIDLFKSSKFSIYGLSLNQPIRAFFKLFPSIPLMTLTMIPLYQYRFDEDSSLGQELLKYKPELF
ncbi:MAG: hypothetical protein AAFQ80_05765 [Cyanobacteria bacterium J06621_8]